MSSPTELITTTKDFDVSNLDYQPAKVDSRGGKRVQFKYKGNPLVLSIPLMFNWGVNERIDENSGRVSYDLSVVFENEKSKVVKQFGDKLLELENKILDDASTIKCMEWFGKSKQSRVVNESLMYPILKYPKDKATGEPDKARNPSLKLKLPYWDEKFTVELYNMDGRPTYIPNKLMEKTPVQLIPSKSHVKGLISCDGIWCAGGRFGVTWKLIQGRVRMPVNLVGTGICHMMDDDDDDELLGDIEKTENETETPETPETDYTGESKADVSAPSFGSDDDEDEEAKPKPKKKIVRRKKAATVSSEAS
jgi:hypothetical protein